jgi:DNA-binding NarL/FixJ family response regulator
LVRFEERGGAEEASRPPKPPPVARLLIADDHALVREGLRIMLSGEVGIEVIAEANDGQQALTLSRELTPDLVLMDVRMPVMDGLEATKKVKREMPQTSVLMVTMHENPDYLFEAVKKAGAAGYVLKDDRGTGALPAAEPAPEALLTPHERSMPARVPQRIPTSTHEQVREPTPSPVPSSRSSSMDSPTGDMVSRWL